MMRLEGRRWYILGLVLMLVLSACSQPRNYREPDKPFFEGNYSEHNKEASNSIKVVSWNTNYAEQLDQIIEALTEEETLRDADVLLLQEMDEISVDLLAQTLNYNYMYYPATIHHHHDKNFGNAILSPWPLDDPEKIVLPNSDPDSKQDRIAVRATILINNHELVAYSVHLEHFWMLPSSSDTQVEALVSQVGKETHPIIIGGDFNSWTPGSIDYLDEIFSEIDLRRVSSESEPTLEVVNGVNLVTDHIFASEFFNAQSGTWQVIEVSDHSAVWAVVSLD